MEIILINDVENVGRRGDIVRVRDGFARNFLLPRKLATASTRANQQFVEEQKVRTAKRREKEKAEAQAAAERLSQVKIKIQAQTGEQDKLFGSVTAEDIAEALKQQGHSFQKKQILLKDSIRSIGTHPVAVELFPHVRATITVEVVRKS
jgi:large subunit ribosomal protein L9